MECRCVLLLVYRRVVVASVVGVGVVVEKNHPHGSYVGSAVVICPVVASVVGLVVGVVVEPNHHHGSYVGSAIVVVTGEIGRAHV